MSHTVMCRKYKEELPGLVKPPYPGPKGQDIYENVSQKAWDEWQAHQTLLINEKHLSMADASARRYLQDEMDKFLAGEDYDKAEGFTPEA